MKARTLGVLLSLGVLACGARTELAQRRSAPADASAGGSADRADSGTGGVHADASQDAELEASSDGATDASDAAVDAPPDAMDAAVDSGDAGSTGDAGDAGDAAVTCTTDSDCDDGIDCTRDRCDRRTFTCVHTPDDRVCDDGIFCDGDERCTVGVGCTVAPRNCADGVACTLDACDEAAKACSHTPRNELCPISHECDPTLGCQARALAHSSSELYSVRLPSGQVQDIGPFRTTSITDIALHPSGVLYGVSFDELYTVDQNTAALTPVTTYGLTFTNAMDAAPDGTLYIANNATVYTLDPATGATNAIATLPGGRGSSGDIALLEGRLLISTTLPGLNDDLVEIDLRTRLGRVIGNIGYDCVYGLAAFGSTLYGMTCEGRILGIDPNTGVGRQLSRAPVVFWGATAR